MDVHNNIFNIVKNKFVSYVSSNDDDSNQITIPERFYDIDSLGIEFKQIIIGGFFSGSE